MAGASKGDPEIRMRSMKIMIDEIKETFDNKLEDLMVTKDSRGLERDWKKKRRMQWKV